MNKPSLRDASVYCFATWAAICMLFIAIRFSSFDVRTLPGVGPILLATLATALLAPVAAMMLAGASLIRQRRALMGWLVLACAVVVFPGHGGLFAASGWL